MRIPSPDSLHGVNKVGLKVLEGECLQEGIGLQLPEGGLCSFQGHPHLVGEPVAREIAQGVDQRVLEDAGELIEGALDPIIGRGGGHA